MVMDAPEQRPAVEVFVDLGVSVQRLQLPRETPCRRPPGTPGRWRGRRRCGGLRCGAAQSHRGRARAEVVQLRSSPSAARLQREAQGKEKVAAYRLIRSGAKACRGAKASNEDAAASVPA